MKDIKFIYTDEVSVPIAEDIVLTPTSIYLDLSKENKKRHVSVATIGEVWNKKLYGIIGEQDNCGPYTVMNDSVFFPNGDNVICKVNNGLLLHQTLEEISRTSKARIKLPKDIKTQEIYDIVNDGNFVYCELERGTVLTLDKNLTLVDCQMQRELIEGELLSANSSYFCATGQFSWNKYINGKLFAKLKLKEGVCDSRIEALAEAMSMLPGETNTRDCVLNSFTDGTELYCLTTKGHIWHITRDNSASLGTLAGNLDEGFDLTQNGLEAMVLTEGSAESFSRGEKVGTNKIDISMQDIIKSAMDRDFLYILTNKKIKRYAIVR